MAKGEHKISVSVPAAGFKRTMYFNRFSLESMGRHVLVHFGLIDESGVLRDHYGCILPHQTLKDSRASLVAYLEKVGGSSAERTQWNPPTGYQRIDVANVVNVAQADVAEIALSSVAIGPAIQKTRDGKPVEADPIALLICEPELQRLLISELYANAED